MPIQSRERLGRTARPRGSVVFSYAIGGAGQSNDPLASFILPLSDLGSGAVNTTPTTSYGSPTPTFTRATAAASRLSTGLWKLDVASGTARSHYMEFSPGLYTYGGYLAEPAATQLATNVRDMTNAAWVKVTMTTAQTSTGLDGVGNSCTRLTAAGANSTILQTLVAAASSRTYSAYVKRITGTGTILLKQGTATLDITALINSTTFTLVQLNDNELNVAYGFQINTNADAIDVDCNQLEAGAVATTPIPAAGTRNADVLQYVYAGNTDIAQGTAYAELASTYPSAGNAPAASVVLCLGVAGRALFVPSGVALTQISMHDTTTQVDKTALTNLGTGIRKRASSWGGAGLVITGDAAAVATGAFDGSLGTSANIQVGSDTSAAQFGGTIRNVQIWPTQLLNAFLQKVTT